MDAGTDRSASVCGSGGIFRHDPYQCCGLYSDRASGICKIRQYAQFCDWDHRSTAGSFRITDRL